MSNDEDNEQSRGLPSDLMSLNKPLDSSKGLQVQVTYCNRH